MPIGVLTLQQFESLNGFVAQLQAVRSHQGAEAAWLTAPPHAALQARQDEPCVLLWSST